MHMSLHEYQILRQGDVILLVKTIMTQAPHIAPLFPVTVMPFFMLFGISIQTAYLVNGLYLFILLLSVFFAAEKIAGRKAAFIAAFLVATFPAVIAYSRDFLLEFPLAALTALSYLFFLKSDSFALRKYAVLFGVSSGLAVLTKTMGIVFFVMPFLYGIYVFIRNSEETRKNVIWTFIAAFCVLAVYYIPNFKQIFGYLFYYGIGAGSQNYDQGASEMASFRYWTLYFEAIACRGISIPYILLFIVTAAAILFSKKKKLSREYWLLWLWFICGYVLLSIPHNKGFEQYALPILPPLAIIIAVHISKISFKTLKYIMLTSVLLIGTTNYVYQTRSERCLYDSFFFKGIPVLVSENSICRMQDAVDMRDDWDITALLHHMDAFNNDKQRIIRVLVAANHNFLNINSLRLYAFLENLKGGIHSEFQFEMLPVNPSDEDELKYLMKESHFIITKTGYQGPAFANVNNSLVKELLGNETSPKIFIISDRSFASIHLGALRLY